MASAVKISPQVQPGYPLIVPLIEDLIFRPAAWSEIVSLMAHHIFEPRKFEISAMVPNEVKLQMKNLMNDEDYPLTSAATPFNSQIAESQHLSEP